MGRTRLRVVPCPIAQDLRAYLSASPTPFHAVTEAVARLEADGYRTIREEDDWRELGPGKYLVTLGGSNLVAFRTPEKPTGFRLVGAHTDSPNLRLKPHAVYEKEGYRQLGVEVYGGALLNSWLDRDLSIAGRVFLREGGTRLVRVDRPLARVTQLAIHLDRDVNDKGLKLDRQDHLPPIWGLSEAGSDSKDLLLSLAAESAGVAESEIAAHELMLFDTLAGAFGGVREEFLFSARLDNLAMCHAGIQALRDAEEGSHVAVLALFDHEEIGSNTAEGAASSFLPRILERLAPDRETFFRWCARSSCVSADMAHAVHPNYEGRHEPRHKVRLNAGPVIKTNAQKRYATSPETAAWFSALCGRAEVPVQHYAHRTDLPCGSTIGPITATLLGIPTVDVGNPMLSMHSAREMCGVEDPARMSKVLSLYFSS